MDDRVPSTRSVYNFVDVVINEYTDYEPLNKIELYFTTNDLEQDKVYPTSYIISPRLIHLEFADKNESNFNEIIDYFGKEYVLSLRVNQNWRSRPFNKLKSETIYKLIIDVTQLKEFTKNGKPIKYYDSHVSFSSKSEFDKHQCNIRK